MIAYVDTSVLLKLLVNDELGGDAAARLWVDADRVLCAEIGYAEARAALATAHRSKRLTASALRVAKRELESLWSQLDVVAVSAGVVRAAGDLAEREHLRGFDAIHLAAAEAGGATVLASADTRLITAARHRNMATSNPNHPRS